MASVARSSGHVEVDGASLYYEESGEGPAVVMIHGFGVDRRMWDDQVHALDGRHRLVRYDLRGFGRSSMPGDAPYSHHADLAGLMDALAIDTAALVGSSMGARIAIDFAIEHPSRTRAIVTVAGVPSGFSFSPLRRRPGDAPDAPRRTGPDPSLLRRTLEMLPPERSEWLKGVVADYSRWHRKNDDPRREIEPPALRRLGSVEAPTLITVGSDDRPDFARAADLLIQGIARSRGHVFEGGRHLPNIEAPEAFNHVLIEFLDENRR
jgi:pimeloyl-ACP methyl ester carboxylesterase